MSDIEPTEGSGDADSGGWLASFFNTTPRVIGSISGLIVAVSGLLIALSKAGLLGGDTPDSKTTPAKTTPAKTTPAETPPQIFSEFNRSNGELSFEGNTMYIEAKQPRSPVVALSNQAAPRDVVMSTRVEWENGAYDYGVSLMCRRRNAKNYYLLAVLPGKGGYSIKKYVDGRLVPLKQGRNRYVVHRRVNKLTVRCESDRPTSLKLFVNGQPLARAYDRDGLPAGDVGIRVGTNQRSEVTVAFVGFRLRAS
jgi:hypothetical protein